MNQLQNFSHNAFGKLEILMKDGKEYFPATYVANLLGYANATEAIKRHCKTEGVAFHEVPTTSGIQNKKFINEPNLYRLIVKSKLPQAEQFEKWVFEEVLPTIRKHGAYMTPNTINALLQDPDLIIGLASQLKQEQQARHVAEQKNLMLSQQIAENASKITYLDQILQSQDTVTVSQVAADYGLSAMKLNKILKDEKVQYKVNNQWLLYSKHQNKGYTKSKTVDVTHSDGSRSVKMNTRWTQKGRLFIHEILTKRGIIPEMDKAAV
ncbi:phage antirepressor KilAC domain-containing protein [Bacillus thuringiensis]|uniref:phage antirepressor KilAC domain-containing protein n=1 Tax=Bacillus thuringiensis TaxID=1428 RepID=UPI000A3690A7|nr:phage antirepressor KilAC domain-containing protein [Bacillus thuringiensis]OUB19517.1 DNA-binding protein [Bacillus thuringiensis serovar yunnanensis]MDR4147901.1 DNA-binding protein [Bacillus thuringiensis]MEC3574938.1 phage antirepressor KilAC domain-containing protein [Bacillus thuringiensis]MED2021413.1 phage antirepressor KilAC domain-containing protein [Bacillus thuringiensis]MED2144737.1 phage antirepressor KilAC domain-containing protein [Bacillus thuringiensis]